MPSYRLIGLALVLLFISHSSSANPPAVVDKNSFLLSMKIEGSNRGWKFTVQNDGTAHLIIDTSPPTTRTFHVSTDQMLQFRKTLAEKHFFDLRAEYGGSVPDDDTRTIYIKQGQRNKTVILKFISVDSAHLPELKRALLVWNAARSWFDDVLAIDLKRFDQRILDAK